MPMTLISLLKVVLRVKTNSCMPDAGGENAPPYKPREITGAVRPEVGEKPNVLVLRHMDGQPANKPDAAKC